MVDGNNREPRRPSGPGALLFRYVAWGFVLLVVLGFVFHWDQR